MNRPTFVAAIGAAVAAPLAGRAQATPTIHAAVPQSADVAPVIYAQKAGLFKKAGLDVDVQIMRSGNVIAAAVAGGSLQIGFSSLPAIITGHQRGLNFQLIAPGGTYFDNDPYAQMVVRSDAPIRTAKDLAGKTIGATSLRDLLWVADQAWLDQNGADLKSVKYVELPNSSLLPSLLENRIDAFAVGQPWVTIALDSGKVRSIGKPFSAIAPHFLMTGYFTTAEFATANRDALARFERALMDATRYANAHKSEMIPILAEVTKQAPELLTRTVKGFDVDVLDPKEVQPMIDATAKYGLIPKPFPAQELISSVVAKP